MVSAERHPDHAMTAVDEDYLRAVERLARRDGAAKTVAIAQELGLSKSSVSEKLKGLAHRGLVHESKYAAITLTAAGRREADRVTYRHRVLETFLHGELGLDERHAHEEAHRLEHAASDEVVRLLHLHLGSPSRDPHGQPIDPARDGAHGHDAPQRRIPEHMKRTDKERPIGR